jgi:hypothetical protein
MMLAFAVFLVRTEHQCVFSYCQLDRTPPRSLVHHVLIPFFRCQKEGWEKPVVDTVGPTFAILCHLLKVISAKTRRWLVFCNYALQNKQKDFAKGFCSP